MINIFYLILPRTENSSFVVGKEKPGNGTKVENLQQGTP